jgi:hypothetical protein
MKCPMEIARDLSVMDGRVVRKAWIYESSLVPGSEPANYADCATFIRHRGDHSHSVDVPDGREIAHVRLLYNEPSAAGSVAAESL